MREGKISTEVQNATEKLREEGRYLQKCRMLKRINERREDIYKSAGC